MAMFFNTLSRKQAEAGVSIPEFLSTHPNPDNRRERVAELAFAMKQQLNLNDPKVGRNSYLQMIDGLVYNEDPRQGFVENGAFNHPELRFTFDVPQGWQTQNSPQQFQMAPEDGSAMMSLSLASGTTRSEAATQLLEGYGFTAEDTRETTYNGLPVTSIIATQQGSDGTTEAVKAKIALIEYNGLVYSIMGLTYASQFSEKLVTFNTVMESFRELTNSTLLNRQPERIKIKTVSNTSTFSQVMSSFGVPSSRHEELAILNGMMVTDQVEKGMLIKTGE